MISYLPEERSLNVQIYKSLNDKRINSRLGRIAPPPKPEVEQFVLSKNSHLKHQTKRQLDFLNVRANQIYFLNSIPSLCVICCTATVPAITERIETKLQAIILNQGIIKEKAKIAPTPVTIPTFLFT